MIKPQSLKRPLFLMGLPGCGKSTLGRALRSIGYEFTDLDEAVELRCGMSVADVIKRNGIDHFRRLEASELQRLIDSDKPQIIACGGGTPCHADNMERMYRTPRMLPRAPRQAPGRGRRSQAYVRRHSHRPGSNRPPRRQPQCRARTLLRAGRGYFRLQPPGIIRGNRQYCSRLHITLRKSIT